MKKILFAIAMGLGLISAPIQPLSAQVEQGKILVDGYVGGPNLATTILKIALRNEDIKNDLNLTSSSVKGLIPLGIKGEYMVNNWLGLGLDFNHARTSVTVAGTDSIGQAYDLAIKLPRNRILATSNFHFGRGNKVDWYGTVGLGVALTTAKLTGDYQTSDPDLAAGIDALKNSVRNTGVGIGYRLGVGMRYFFTPRIGLNLELGTGGPAFKGGLSVSI